MNMTFKGISSTTAYLAHCVPLPPILPLRDRQAVKIVGRDGLVDFGRDSYGSRTIPVDMLVTAASESTMETYLEAVANFLAGEGWIVFDASTKRYWGKVVEQITTVRNPGVCQFVAYFECEPWAEDVDAITEDVDTEIDYDSPLTFYPQINVSLTADSDFVQVSLLSTGEYVRVEGDFANGDDFVFDMSTAKVTRNDSNIGVTLSSRFFGVPTGNQTIVVTADSTYTADMTYRRRYRYA